MQTELLRWGTLAPVLLLSGCGGPPPGEWVYLSVIVGAIPYGGSFPFVAIGHYLLRRNPRLTNLHVLIACFVLFVVVLFPLATSDPEIACLLIYVPIRGLAGIYLGLRSRRSVER